MEALTFFVNDESWSDEIRKRWWLFLASGFLYGVFSAWPRLTKTGQIRDMDVEVCVAVRDVFRGKEHLIVSCKSTFDTDIEQGVISGESVQGQFTKKFFPNLDSLNVAIERELRNVEAESTLSQADRPVGKRTKYGLGTTVAVRTNGRHAYLVAVAHLNRNHVAGVENEAFLDMLPKMWTSIREKSEYGSLCCPIIGAGASRVNIPRNDLVKHLVRSFIAASIEGKFAEKLVIAIPYSDFSQGKISLDEIGEFLQAECASVRIRGGARPETQIGQQI